MAQSERDKPPRNIYQLASLARTESTRPGEYLRNVQIHLRDGRTKEAYAILLKAIAQHPDDPLLLSYYGYLQVLVDRKFRSGITACTRAILLLKKDTSFSEAELYPVFYLNLGRACIAAGKRKDAIVAFKNGLRYDAGNSDLWEELRNLGVRKKPPLSFLSRSHPINKVVGKILHRRVKKPR